MVVLAPLALDTPGKLKRANTQRSYMIKPAPGPRSDFYTDLLPTKADSIHRNTATHWHIHWYMITRGRPLMKFTTVSALVKDVSKNLEHAVTQRLPGQQNKKTGIAARTMEKMEKALNFSDMAKNRWEKAFIFSLADNDDADADGIPQKKTLVGIRAKVWYACENNPVINTLLLVFILLSTIADIVETETKVAGPPDSSANIAMNNIDITCIVVFTVEFITRLICCPSLKGFARNGMNWIDLLAILPSYVSWIVVASANTSNADAILQVCAHAYIVYTKSPCPPHAMALVSVG
jgi:hypothetical protein